MPSRQQLEKSAWDWVDSTEPQNVNQSHIFKAYRLDIAPCKSGTCRRNCKGNPRCWIGLGESNWVSDIKDLDSFHDIGDPADQKRKLGSYVGLKNLGATCYVNTFLQVWFHNVEFRNAIFKWEEPVSNTNKLPSNDVDGNENSDDLELLLPSTVCGHLQLLFALLQFSERKVIDPTQFIKCLGLDTGQQQDAQEFSKLFISLLEENLSTQANKQVARLVQSQFCGQYDYVTECKTCLTESQKASSFYELDVNIKGHKDLMECIDEFLHAEELKDDNRYMCSVCQSKQEASRHIQLRILPTVLNFQLLRFVFDRQTGMKKKLNSIIQFPEVLDLSKYLNKPAGEILYELTAVLIHRGPSAYSGHYIAHVKDSVSGMWYKFNDEDVQQMSGKNLQLGTDDELVNSGKEDKKPKIPKGFYATKNAYMLVYRQQMKDVIPYKEVVFEDLPSKLREYVALDNARLEDFIQDLIKMREEKVANGQAYHAEMRQLYLDLSTVNDESFEWISTEWLMQWLKSNATDLIPPISNISLLCKHGCLNPRKVENAKCVSAKGAEALFNKYLGGPRLGTEALCKDCVTTECRIQRLRSQLQTDTKLIGSLLKESFDHNGHNEVQKFWVSKSSLRNWRQLALSMLSKADKGLLLDQDQMDVDNPNDKKSLEEPKVFGEDEKEEEMSFNADLLCSLHGQLSPETSLRRLVCEEIWAILKKYFPQAPEYPAFSEVCSECEKSNQKSAEEYDLNRATAQQQKQDLLDLYLDRRRPVWTGTFSQLFLITTQFVENWRLYVKDCRQSNQVTSLNNDSALCLHRKLSYDPSSLCDGSISLLAQKPFLQYVTQSEWNVLKTHFTVDVQIAVTRIVDEEGRISFLSEPELCTECCAMREENEIQAKYNYVNAILYVRKISQEEHLQRLSNAEMSCSSPIDVDLDASEENIMEQNDLDPVCANFQNGVKRTKTAKLSDVPACKSARIDSVLPVRRSSRHHRVRGEVEVEISSNCTLRDLKLKIMRLFKTPPFDQHLVLGNKELVGDKESLANLKLLPGSVVYLWADEPIADESTLEEDHTCMTSPEAGFKGTNLMRNHMLADIMEKDDNAASICDT